MVIDGDELSGIMPEIHVVCDSGYRYLSRASASSDPPTDVETETFRSYIATI